MTDPRVSEVGNRKRNPSKRNGGDGRGVVPARHLSAATARKTRPPGPKPFTVPHFRAWARRLILDTGEPWVLEPFQARFLGDLFAGTSENWLVLPEGNAKTTFVGGIALYFAEHREWSDIPVAASARDQAEILYRAAAGFVERTPGMTSRFRAYDGYRRIICRSNHSRIQIFASDDRTGDGVQPTLAVLEELHRHRSLDLYRTWRGKIEKRGGQLIAISTAGEPEGEFEETRQRMRDAAVEVTRKGSFLRAVGPTICLHEYAVPDGGDPDRMTDVKKANPLKAITTESLKRKHSSPAMTPAHWRRFVCGLPAKLEAWIDPKTWDDLEVDVGGVKHGDPVIVGLRVAAGAGIALASPRSGGRVAVAAKVIPAPPNARVSLEHVEFVLRQIVRDYKVQSVMFDPKQFRRSAEILVQSGVPMLETSQSPGKMAEATSTLWRLISAGLLVHDGDPELRKQVLAGETKEVQTGWQLVPTEQTTALIAMAFAAHVAAELEQVYWVI